MEKLWLEGGFPEPFLKPEMGALWQQNYIQTYLESIADIQDLYGHPKMGSSWEGFVIEQIYQLKPEQCGLFFFRTHNRAELDLIIEKNGKPIAGIEIKFEDKAGLSRGNTEAANELDLEKRYIIRQGGDEWVTKNGFIVTSLDIFLKSHLPHL